MPAGRRRVLIDTSAWLHHIRHGDPVVTEALRERIAAGHVDVAGELRVGSGQRAVALSNHVLELQRVLSLDQIRLMAMLDDTDLRGRGIGWTDAAIVLACATCAMGTALYTRDRRMAEAARRIGVELHPSN